MEFGILGTAGIAQKAVIPAICASEHTVGAIASREPCRARAVAEEFDVPRHYGSYESLLVDDWIDAVYVPLPNALHAEWTRRAADAGLDVLCEKPLATDAAEAMGVVDHCRQRGVVLMEAFMYRYHPRTERVLELVREELDDIRSVTATFDWPVRDPDDIRLSADLAGGSLMDVGCYAVSIARAVLGEPTAAIAHTVDSRNCGVETDVAGLLLADDGRSARIAAGFDTRVVDRYRIEAANGWIEVENAFLPGDEEVVGLKYAIDDEVVVETFEPVDQYRREIDHFADCIDDGQQPWTGGEEAVANMRAIDALYESARRGERVAVDHNG